MLPRSYSLGDRGAMFYFVSMNQKAAHKRKELTSASSKGPKSFVKGAFNAKDQHYYEAKKQGFVARSVFKLGEIDAGSRLLHANDDVLDLGCSPGSWLQYVDKKITQGSGHAVGLDLQTVMVPLSARIKVVQGDIYAVSPAQLFEYLASTGSTKTKFDLVLSDMAPKTTGVKSMDQYNSFELSRQALEIASSVLAPNGRFCVKIFEGPEMKEFVTLCKAVFAVVQIKRPQAIRSASKEIYVIGLQKKS